MPWVDPIFDWTLYDVVAADHSSPEPQKGARNYTDLIRITGNIHYLRDLLVASGISAPPPESKTAWVLGEVPPYSEIDKIRRDIEALKSAFFVSSATPDTPNLPYTHFQKLNDIEKILFDIEVLFGSVVAAFRHSGTFNSGMEGAIRV